MIFFMKHILKNISKAVKNFEGHVETQKAEESKENPQNSSTNSIFT